MSAKLVLYFTAGGRELYRWQGGALELEARFTPDPEGLGDFRARLKGRQGALVYVLADLAGEDFQEDQIPYLRGGDRESVVQRRLAQRYRDTRLATGVQQYRAPYRQAAVTAMPLNSPRAMRSRHSAGPVSCTLVPVASTATVTGMSRTSNS